MSAGALLRATSLALASLAAPFMASVPLLRAQSGGAPGSTSPSLATPQADTAGIQLVPPGFGTLRQDDISLHIDAGTVLVRALPLDESVIRLLTPDSYRALRDLKEGSRNMIAATARRYGGRPVSVWLVSFYGVEPSARFTPGDLVVTSGGRDFKPFDVVSLTVGFGENRLRQRETQSALYIYDGDVQVNQPVTLAYQGAIDASWDDTLQRVERERAMVRARASKPN